MDRRPCADCKFVRSFNMRWTCRKYLAYVRSDNTCDSWEDGRWEVLPVLNKYSDPTKDEEAFLKASEIKDLRFVFSDEQIKSMQQRMLTDSRTADQ